MTVRNSFVTRGCYNNDVERQVRSMTASNYDPESLARRAAEWRMEAEAATLKAMRVFCLSEAEKCEMRAERSLRTPVISDSDLVQGAGR